MKKGFIFLTILLLVSMIFAGCGGTTTTSSTSSSTTSTSVASTSLTSTSLTSNTVTSPAVTTTPAAATPKHGGTLKLIYDSAPSGSIGYPPELQGDATTAPQLCFESFLREDNQGNFTPWLAESYKLADDDSSITFHLRQGVTFHDGSSLNATVAKWNLENTIAAKEEPFWSSVEVVDDYTIQINFSQWQNTMMGDFAGASTWMISETAFDKNGLDWVRQNPVGTGPFKFVSFVKDTSFTTVRYPNYWGKDANGNQLPYLDGVEFLFISDPQTQEATMESGEADMLVVKHGDKVESDLVSRGFTAKSAATDTSAIFGDTANPDSPWSNLEVREAAEYAIDRDAIGKMGYGYWKPAYQIPGSSDPTYDPNFSLGRPYDPDKAKQLLTEAGYPNGFTTTLVACPSSLDNDVVVAIQGYLAQVGIKADIQYPDLGKFIQDYWIGTWHNAIIYEPIAGFPNYMTIFAILFNPATNFHPSWQRTPDWLAAYNAALAAPEANIQLEQAATDLLVKDCLMTPINEGGRGWVYASYVEDIGAMELELAPFLKVEQAWLNK